MSIQTQYLGQLVPAPKDQGMNVSQKQNIVDVVTTAMNGKEVKVEISIASKNNLKCNSGYDAVQGFVTEIFQSCMITSTKGYDVESGVSEQPHGLIMTKKGAKNRLKCLYAHVKPKENIEQDTCDGVLRFLVSMENGIMKEKIVKVKNKERFKLPTGETWVDRCYVIIEIWFNAKKWKTSALSEGVITPLSAVEKSQNSGWNKTAGSFIGKEFKCNPKDWHKQMAGKSREPIMRETLKTALGT